MSGAVIKDMSLPPNQSVVDELEGLLSLARSGSLRGFVVFTDHGGGYNGAGQAGTVNFGAILAGFEDWKFRRVWERNRTDEP